MGDCLFALPASVFPAPAGRTENSPGLQPWERYAQGNRPHKEPGGITFEFGSMRTVSGNDGCELKAHLACSRREAF
jgi:hypothetical protein